MVPDSEPPPMQHYYMGTVSADATESQSDTNVSKVLQKGAVITEELQPPLVVLAIVALLALPKITVAPVDVLDPKM